MLARSERVEFAIDERDELTRQVIGVPPDRWQPLFDAFTVPERFSPVGVVSLGYPAPDVRSPSLRRGRRSLENVVSYGTFG